MRQLPLAILAMAALLGSGCMPTEEQLRLQREVLELTRRLDNTERNLRLVQEETAGGVRTRLEALSRSQAELQAGVDGVRVDQQGNQGRFDDLGRADAALRQDLTLLRDELGLQVADLGQRLARLEQAAAAAAVPATPAEESADALYERGLQAIRDRQEPAAGRELMTTFLKRYPADPRAVNAAYWVGETYYAEKAYDKAALQFEEVVQKYGDDPKVAAALYKQALAFEALKDRASARLVMKKLTERFPLSEEAKKAKEKLKEWGK
ncbi:MAG: tol-pal system protein YbgF [Deltaproteobacteria bacterium]|nr:MAG: tol-pal system protein YbgF [Deltaproteobacteria bacterium]